VFFIEANHWCYVVGWTWNRNSQLFRISFSSRQACKNALSALRWLPSHAPQMRLSDGPFKWETVMQKEHMFIESQNWPMAALS